ncbi:MAG: hypothetical protein LC725_02445 [Lentisphaerae bacterium]|nr:hypothetical protein [Lentisphaerota bacterium]
MLLQAGHRLGVATVLCWLLVCSLSAQATVTNQVTVAVLDFAQTDLARENQSHRWLSKAFSDLLIGDLVAHRGLRLVNRENMRLLMQEADLRMASGLTEDLIDPDEYRKLQQYVKIDQMVLGTFSINQGRINIQARIIDHAHGAVLARFSQTGDLNQALELEKTLARDMLHYFSGGEISPEAWELPSWTDSMAASELLYNGVDAFDAGQYNQAWFCFRRAARVDPDYADALYWIGRMHYYRQDYQHAHTAYRNFVERFPRHNRVGDAITEYVHSQEGGVLQSWQSFIGEGQVLASGGRPAGVPPSPDALLEIYRDLRAHDWSGVYVRNKVDYASRSPLADWLIKREQQALAYLGYLPEAFALLEEGLLTMPEDSNDAMAQSWRGESSRLMSIIAMESEDLLGERLSSEFLEARDYQLTVEDPVAGEDLRDRPSMRGQAGNRWGTNWRILAPTGYSFNKVHTTIMRTNDPELGSTCRLQLRRYRYVDIDGCSVGGRGTNSPTIHKKTVQMPPGSTWFFLRPEHHNRTTSQSGFDEWSLVAELEPIPENAGAIIIDVENTHEHNTYINGVYTRCFNGVVGNLAPGKYQVEINCMWPRRAEQWAFEPLCREVEVGPQQVVRLPLQLALKDTVRDMGWHDPVGIARNYPTYKHRPRPDSNWLDGPPAVCVDQRTGQYLAVWAHLDDLWFSISADGLIWSDPDTLPPPVNSADAEINPRVLLDQQGRYWLLFLSNRGISRNLAAYVSWSRNLVHWSRPVMLHDQHHSDIDLIQDNQGRYLLLLTPSDTPPDDANPQDSVISLQASKDMAEWHEPVPQEVWRNIFALTTIVNGEPVPDTLRPLKARIVQDRHGVYHLIWLRKNSKTISRAWSRDLQTWSSVSSVKCNTTWNPFNIAVAATDEKLMVAMISSDGSYSGTEMFGMVALPLLEDEGWRWRDVAIPPIAISGMPAMIHDDYRRQLVLAWQIAEQKLHATRLAGPVYFMTGQPALLPLEPLKLRRTHIRASADLEKFIERLAQGEVLGEEDVEQARKIWKTYNDRLRLDLKQEELKLIETLDCMGYYVNALRMAAIDPQDHGGWPTRFAYIYGIHSSLQHQVEAMPEQADMLVALIIPAICRSQTDEALKAYKQLRVLDEFRADWIVRIVQLHSDRHIGRFQPDSEPLAAAQLFLESIK